MVRILISGASGFVGTSLHFYLVSQGINVFALSRSPRENAIFWDVENQIADPNDFEGFDAVIHLAGEPLSLSRWNQKKKEKILQSRVLGTRLLVDVLSKVTTPPKLFLTASAVGFYGDRKGSLLTEESAKGRGFLARVVSEWEQESFLLEKLGIRVVQTRFGIVLGPNGGALSKMLLPYRLGLGSVISKGDQWMSWVHIEDLIRALLFIIEEEKIEGAVNVVSPNPVQQKDFSEILASVLKKPHFLKIPIWMINILLGEAGRELLLSSARVYPAKLLAAKFQFNYSDLRSALLHIILQENL